MEAIDPFYRTFHSWWSSRFHEVVVKPLAIGTYYFTIFYPIILMILLTSTIFSKFSTTYSYYSLCYYGPEGSFF